VLYGANRDFAYVDARALSDAKVKGDLLKHGELRWRVLVLPATDTLPLAAWENVARFWRKGGVVVAVGALPANSADEWPAPRVQAIARELFGAGAAPCTATNATGGVGVLLPTGMLALVPKVIDSLLERDAACADAKARVRITHRRVDEHDVYFAINDSDAAWSGELRFCGRGVTEKWDPVTGKMSPLSEGKKVSVQLGPYGAMLFRAKAADRPQRLGGAGAAGLSLTCEPLPSAKVTVSGGQYVRSELAGDDASGWCARAALTKGQVDTHQFMSFSYDQPLALGDSAGLMIDSSVPEGQRTPAELLVFIHTKDGGDHIASTGRYLNVPGPARAYVMFSQFKPFGGSKTTKGPMDLSQVAAIRVGWGGYFGAEGEKLVLTVNSPQRFVCGSK
jgi:hypothetical protein